MISKVKAVSFILLLGFLLIVPNTLGMEQKLGIAFESQDQLNEFVGGRCVQLFAQLTNCSRYPDLAKGESPEIPGETWKIHKMPIAYKQYALSIYKDRSFPASVALKLIFDNSGNILDCQTASHIVLAQCLSEIYGDTFDDLYRCIEEERGLLPLSMFVASFCNDCKASVGSYSHPGGLVLVKNLPDYGVWNPLGCFLNDNLITVTDEKQNIKYMGFGSEYRFGPFSSDYKFGPLSYHDVRKYMLKAYSVGRQATTVDIEAKFDAIQDYPIYYLSLDKIKEHSSQVK
jgi:hypothetical protein